ncbi:hypothetical protein MPL1032_130168 [Mesorhizobium plurifarium]|uniref:Uncharacterized protein n=1 Tax=Mesorhizobium plurifarium TaxID=69974 RepID=A0A0K2VR83_MESPL|nr:hypothetical protein MPL1032_130168 [Mesorhizobium plurifarium]
MVGPEGQRLLQEKIRWRMFSPTHSLRILSYGLANLRTLNEAIIRSETYRLFVAHQVFSAALCLLEVLQAGAA